MSRIVVIGLVTLISLRCSSSFDLTDQTLAFFHARNERDMERVMSFYADDCRVVLPDREPIIGTSAVREWEAWLAATETHTVLGDPTVVLPKVLGHTARGSLSVQGRWLWLLGIRRFVARESEIVFRNGQIAEFRVAELPDIEDQLGMFREWLATHRPREARLLFDGDQVIEDASRAAVWFRLLEEWRLSRPGPFSVEIEPTAPLFPFGVYPTFRVVLTPHRESNWSDHSGQLHPTLQAAVSVAMFYPDGRLGVHSNSQSISVAGREPESSVVLEFPENRELRVRDYSYRHSQRALLPGTYYHAAQLRLSDGERRDRYISQISRLEITDDGSEELAAVREAQAGIGVQRHLRLTIERRAETGVQLMATNTGDSPLHIGEYYAWLISGPEGEDVQASGPRGDQVIRLGPGESASLQRQDFRLSKPGRYRIRAVYVSHDAAVAVESNALRLTIPGTVGGQS